MQLLDYIKTLPIDQKPLFAKQCGTTLGYLRKAVCRNQKLGSSITVNIERYSNGAVTCEEVRPDVDWAYIRNKRNKRGARKK